MMNRHCLFGGFLLWLVAAMPAMADAAPLKLKSGDHIAIIGDTLADRMQHDCWLETFIVAKYPQLDLVFRNLAVAGDEVAVRHRSESFGSPDDWLKKVKADLILAFFAISQRLCAPAAQKGSPLTFNTLHHTDAGELARRCCGLKQHPGIYAVGGLWPHYSAPRLRLPADSCAPAARGIHSSMPAKRAKLQANIGLQFADSQFA